MSGKKSGSIYQLNLNREKQIERFLLNTVKCGLYSTFFYLIQLSVGYTVHYFAKYS